MLEEEWDTGKGLQRGVTLLLSQKELGEFYDVEFYRVSEGHTKDRGWGNSICVRNIRQSLFC